MGGGAAARGSGHHRADHPGLVCGRPLERWRRVPGRPAVLRTARMDHERGREKWPLLRPSPTAADCSRKITLGATLRFTLRTRSLLPLLTAPDSQVDLQQSRDPPQCSLERVGSHGVWYGLL